MCHKPNAEQASQEWFRGFLVASIGELQVGRRQSHFLVRKGLVQRACVSKSVGQKTPVLQGVIQGERSGIIRRPWTGRTHPEKVGSKSESRGTSDRRCCMVRVS